MGIALVLVLVSLSILLAYMGWRDWPIANTILAVAILWSSMGFFYLATRALKTHQAWGTAVLRYQADMRAAREETHRLREGTPATGEIGLRQLNSQLNDLTVKRGRVWYDVTVDKRDAATGGATITVPSPTPHLIVPKSVVFAFEKPAGDNPGRYVGEFHVTDVKDKTVELVPALTLTDDERQLISQSNGPWTLYGMMPMDDPQVYASLSDAEKQRWLPPEAAAKLGDPKRPLEDLNDYALLFQQLQARKVLLLDAIQKTQNDIARTQTATKQTEQDIVIRQREKENLAHDLKRFQSELAVITAYEKALGQQLGAVRKAVTTSVAAGQQHAAELTVLQLKAAEEIDRRAPSGREAAAAR